MPPQDVPINMLPLPSQDSISASAQLEIKLCDTSMKKMQTQVFEQRLPIQPSKDSLMTDFEN